MGYASTYEDQEERKADNAPEPEPEPEPESDDTEDE